MPAYIATVIILSAILQGSYGAIVYVLAAAALTVPLFARFHHIRPKVLMLPLLLLSIWMPVSTAVNGFSGEGFAASLIPLASLVGFSAVLTLDKYERWTFVTVLCIGSACMAAIGLVDYSGLVDFGYGSGKHLVFGFGESNMAAAWFAACVLLAQGRLSDNHLLGLSIPLNVIGLLLTCSTIVIPLWLICELIVLIRSKKDNFCRGCITVIFISAVLALLAYFAQASIVVPIVVLVAAAVLGWFSEELILKIGETRVVWVCCAITVVAVVIGTVFSQRVQTELPLMLKVDFIEMGDALTCITSNPIFGLGSGQWNFLGGAYQSTAFSGMTVPNAYLQLGVEGGFVALFLAVATILAAICAAVRNDIRAALPMVLLTVASLISASFNSLAYAVLFFAVSVIGEKDNATGGNGRIPRFLAMALNCIFCVTLVLGLIGMAQVMLFQRQASDSDAEASDITAEFAEEPSWVTNSPSARSMYDQWLIYELTTESYEGRAVGIEAEKVLKAVKQINLYDYVAEAYIHGTRYEWDEGLECLISAMKLAPYNASLCTTVEDYLINTSPSEDLIDEILELAKKHGYEISYTPLTDKEQEAFKEARDSYIETYES